MNQVEIKTVIHKRFQGCFKTSYDVCTISLFIIIYLANVSAEEAAQEKQAFYEMRL